MDWTARDIDVASSVEHTVSRYFRPPSQNAVLLLSPDLKLKLDTH